MKICFLFPNSKISEMNFSEIEKGNPGIGGTEFAIYTVCYKLAKFHEVILLSEVPVKECYSEINNIVFKNDYVTSLNDIHPDIFVVHHSPYVWQRDSLDRVSPKIKIIVWVHNFLSTAHLNRYSLDEKVSRIVFVGREMYDKYRDHSIIYKSSYIYNPFFITEDDFLLAQQKPYVERDNIVVYVGNIIPGKGFHLLAKAWKKILNKKPDAQLKVIGTGKLYNKSEKLGKYGIANEKYESEFMPFLTDDNGNILDSVHFLGILGKEKESCFLNAKIGVPNPSGVSETFGYTAVEMSKMGMMITTKKVEGYLDTVPNTAGILYNNPNQLAECIVKLLSAKNEDYAKTFSYLTENFSTDHVALKWCKLLKEVYDNVSPVVLSPTGRGKLKKIKELNRVFKKTFHCNIFPSVDAVQQYFSIKHIKLIWISFRRKSN